MRILALLLVLAGFSMLTACDGGVGLSRLVSEPKVGNVYVVKGRLYQARLYSIAAYEKILDGRIADLSAEEGAPDEDDRDAIQALLRLSKFMDIDTALEKHGADLSEAQVASLKMKVERRELGEYPILAIKVTEVGPETIIVRGSKHVYGNVASVKQTRKEDGLEFGEVDQQIKRSDLEQAGIVKSAYYNKKDYQGAE